MVHLLEASLLASTILLAQKRVCSSKFLIIVVYEGSIGETHVIIKAV
jgi:hypothetical protein